MPEYKLCSLLNYYFATKLQTFIFALCENNSYEDQLGRTGNCNITGLCYSLRIIALNNEFITIVWH